jgi:hypothetical protein
MDCHRADVLPRFVYQMQRVATNLQKKLAKGALREIG